MTKHFMDKINVTYSMWIVVSANSTNNTYVITLYFCIVHVGEYSTKLSFHFCAYQYVFVITYNISNMDYYLRQI
jgi:hypothetical protein